MKQAWAIALLAALGSVSASAEFRLVGGEKHACVLSQGTELQCWGNPFHRPTRTFETPLREYAGGAAHSCTAGFYGEIECWGQNTAAQTHFQRAQIPGLPLRARSVAANSTTTCAALETGHVTCWGGWLGADRNEAASAPAHIQDAVQVVLGDQHGCALLESGEAQCWGSYFQYDPRTRGWTQRVAYPSPPRALRFQKIHASLLQVCGLTLNHRATCWGPTLDSSPGLTANPEWHGLQQVVSGLNFVCALTREKRILCETRDGAAWALRHLLELTGVEEITAGPRYLCARTPQGVLCRPSYQGHDPDRISAIPPPFAHPRNAP
jgi:alpha-tubulin suppressor-like RCC1 family protein